MKYAVRSLLLSILAVAALSCDKATPTAPSGSTLAITANPAKIGLNGRSTITIIGRQPNGSPMREGTEIRLSSSLGTVDPLVLIGSDGNATATLRGDGRKGAATVTAQTGTVSGGGSGGAGASGGSTGSSSGSLSVTTTVQIGESDDTKPTVLISASPATVPVGGTSTITIIARNSDGSPAASGQTVLLTSSLGILSTSRPQTRSDGTATATLSAGNEAGTAKITAILGSSEAATTDVTIRDAATSIFADADPKQIQDDATTTIKVTAVVRNAQGLPVAAALVQFVSVVGSFGTSSVDFTDSSGVAEITLTVRPQDIPDGTTSFKVSANTSSGTGAPLKSEVTITVV
ncbi:MAG TPA: Ig-like domain-containing protein [Thermoanaerobaculia bacterium]|nr:Ig-like domain-containing protein [Thermoanaerobaculia bacterium]